MSNADGGACELCERTVRKLTRHHLVPRTRHKNKRNKKTFDRRKFHHTVGLCFPCHRHVHVVLDNKELEREYNTLEALRAHPDVGRFVEWIKRKPHGTAPARPTATPDEKRRCRRCGATSARRRVEDFSLSFCLPSGDGVGCTKIKREAP